MIIKKLWDFISKRPQILKFHIFERYIDFYFKSNFDAVFVFELIEPRGYCNIWTDFLCLLPFQSKVNRKGPTSWIPKFEHSYFASNFKFAYLTLEIVKCPKYNGCSIIMCPAIYCFKTNNVSTLAFLCTWSTSPCRYADLHHCQETFSVIKHFLEVIGFLYNFFFMK
jgi:hypothetical protein